MLLVTTGCEQKHPEPSSAAGRAVEFTINLKSEGKPVADIILKLDSNFATATVAGETEKFNLKEMSWFNSTAGKWVTLEQCTAWAAQSKQKSQGSINSAPEHMRPFFVWSLDPIFKVTNSDGTLRLDSDHVDYLVEGEASKSEVGGYFRYAILNAYKKAMTERKLPPFSELKAIEEMKALGHIPRRISVKMPGIPGSPAFDMEISETKQEEKKDGAGTIGSGTK